MEYFNVKKLKEFISNNKEQTQLDNKNVLQDIPSFLNKLAKNKLSATDLLNILNAHPELSHQTYQGLHSLHYAIISNNATSVNYILRYAIHQGMTEFPVTGITSESKYENNQHILNFCYKHGSINGFTEVFARGDFDESSVQPIVSNAMVDLNPDFMRLFKNVYGLPTLENYNQAIFSQPRYSPILAKTVVSAKGNIKLLKGYGYNFFREGENGTLLHSLLENNNMYYLESSFANAVPSQIFDNMMHTNVMSVFFENILYHKDLNVNSMKNNTPLYPLLENFLTECEYYLRTDLTKKYQSKLEELILDAISPKAKNQTVQKIKF